MAALELVQASALIHDDLMDRSDTRRGEPSVHRRFERRHVDAGWRGGAAAFGMAAKAVLDELKAVGPVAELTGRINSPGGSVFDGVAVYNALKRHDAVITVWIDGIAASIASMIARAGDEIVMPENAMLMLHDPSGLVMGTAADMRTMAEALDRMRAGMVAAYRDKSGRDDAEIEALMAAETWLSAQEAVDLGLADRIEQRRRHQSDPRGLARIARAQPRSHCVEVESDTRQQRPKAVVQVASHEVPHFIQVHLYLHTTRNRSL